MVPNEHSRSHLPELTWTSPKTPNPRKSNNAYSGPRDLALSCSTEWHRRITPKSAFLKGFPCLNRRKKKVGRVKTRSQVCLFLRGAPNMVGFPLGCPSKKTQNNRGQFKQETQPYGGPPNQDASQKPEGSHDRLHDAQIGANRICLHGFDGAHLPAQIVQALRVPFLLLLGCASAKQSD